MSIQSNLEEDKEWAAAFWELGWNGMETQERFERRARRTKKGSRMPGRPSQSDWSQGWTDEALVSHAESSGEPMKDNCRQWPLACDGILRKSELDCYLCRHLPD